jgi:hypothetical protein
MNKMALAVVHAEWRNAVLLHTGRHRGRADGVIATVPDQFPSEICGADCAGPVAHAKATTECRVRVARRADGDASI